MINPYYHPEKLGLKMETLDEPDLCYEYNTLVFWTLGNGRVFTAQDTGCSCPEPFERYEVETIEEFYKEVEQVESPEAAQKIIEGWCKGYGKKPFLDVGQIENHMIAIRGWFWR